MKQKFTNKNILKFFIYNIVFVCTLYFIYQSLPFSNLKFNFIIIRPIPLVGGIILLLLFYLILAFAWQTVLSFYVDIDQNKGVYSTFLSSQIFKYLPSSLFLLSFKAYFTRQFGITLKQATLAILMEHAFLIYFSLMIFALLLYPILGIFMIMVEFIGIILLMKNIIPANRLPIIGRLLDAPFFTVKKLLIANLLYLFGYMFGGLGFYLFVIGFGQSPEILKTLAYQSGSIGISILAVFAPGGLGVKEYILSETGINLSIIVMFRFANLLIEFISTVVGLILQHYYGQNR